MFNLTVDTAHTFYVGANGWLVHNARTPSSTYNTGSYGTTRSRASRLSLGGEVHHMPANEVNGLSYAKGPAIWMSEADHGKTASYGSSNAAKAYRQLQADLISQGRFQEAMQMDIDDIHAKFGNKYDRGIEAAKEYARTKLGINFPIPTSCPL